MTFCRHLARYEKLINFYKTTVIEGYIEKHHIVPVCMGGTDDFENLVGLPPRAHYLAHYLLWKAYPSNNKLAHAFAMMGVNNQHQHRVLRGKLYELSKLARSHALKGKRLSEEVKQKMRKPKVDGHRQKLLGNKNASGNRGNKLPPRKREHTEKLVAAQRWYHENTVKETHERISRYRKDFVESGMTRRQFAEHTGVNYSTMKKYLRGI